MNSHDEAREVAELANWLSTFPPEDLRALARFADELENQQEVATT